MSGSVKMYGIMIYSSIIISFTLLFYTQLISKDELFNAIRTTQLSTIKESINIGDLIVNNKISLNDSKANTLWNSNFKSNVSTNNSFNIDFLKINSNYPYIAVNVISHTKNLKENYSNVVIVDRLIQTNIH